MSLEEEKEEGEDETEGDITPDTRESEVEIDEQLTNIVKPSTEDILVAIKVAGKHNCNVINY